MTRRKGASDLFPIHLHFWTALDSLNEVLQFYRQSHSQVATRELESKHRVVGAIAIDGGRDRYISRVLNLCSARTSWPMRCSRIGKHVEFDTNGESRMFYSLILIYIFYLISALDLPTFIYTISVHHYPPVPPLRCHHHWRRRAA